MTPSPSIRSRLLLRLLITVFLTSILVVWIVYQSARNEINMVFDTSLVHEAWTLGTLLNHEADEEQRRSGEIQWLLNELGEEAVQRSPLFEEMVNENRHTADRKDYLHLPPPETLPDYHYKSKITFIARYMNGQIMVRSPNTHIFETPHTGFQTLTHNHKSWRVYTLIMPDSHLWIQVSEDTALRRVTITDMLNQVLWPLFIMIPLLGIIIWIGVGKGLMQLRQVAEKVETRDPTSLDPISIRGVPREVLPMVISLNHLFQRVEAVLENERRFTSDAAHEMRNPIAALKTQAQALQLGTHDEDTNRFLRQVVLGVDRASHLLEQLLTLARADARQRQNIPWTEINLYSIAQTVLSDHGHLALEKNIDLSLEGDEEIFIQGDKLALEILLRNVLDNAIRYTPTGGKIRVQVARKIDSAQIRIEDSGPGIPPEQRDIIFQRFKRGDQVSTYGSGIGLSIAKQIAGIHGARIQFETATSGHGLLVKINFPLHGNR